MKEYINLISDVLNEGEYHQNRTGIDTIRVWGKSLKMDLGDGFPLLTTKKMAVKSSFTEMLGFIRGETDIRWYQERGCKIWNKNHQDWHGKQKDDDIKKLSQVIDTIDKNNLEESIEFRDNNPHSLGYIYGYQWRNMNGYDQLKDIFINLLNRSNSRRLIMSAWNPSQFHLMCLPPCHVTYHFSIRNDKYLDISMWQRSVDCGLGLPFNLANTALLCHVMSKCADLSPGRMCWFGDDVHIYENHVDQLKEQITRKPYKLPKLFIDPSSKIPWEIEYNDIRIVDYKHHDKIKMDMAV